MTSTSVARTVGVVLGIAWLCNATATDVLRDGNWWLKTDPEERIGYLAGYMDCGAYDARETRLERGSWYNLEPKIDSVYRKEPSKRRLPVASVLLDLAPHEPIGSGSKRGERNPAKHGFFDGQY
jgi:hypothetical protein